MMCETGSFYMDFGTKNKAILLVEDDTITATVEIQQLKKIGYRVGHVSNGEDAIDNALDPSKNYDLILMDIDLGDGIDGTEAAEEILKKQDIPIVFLSSHTESKIVEKTEKITSYGYVVKNSGIVVLDASIKMAFKLFEAKNELLISRRVFKSAFEDAALGFCFLSLDGKFLNVNQSFLEITGYSEAELINRSANDITHPDDQKIGMASREKLIKTGSGKEIIEKRYIHKDSSVIYVSIAASLVTSKENEPLYFIIQVNDISEMRRTEYLNKTMAKMLDIAPNSITIHDPSGQFHYANEKTFELHGYTENEFMSMNLHDLDDPESAKLIKDRFKEVFEKEFVNVEVKHYKKDGSLIPLDVIAKPVDWFGKECVMAIATDLTEQKKYIELLKKSESKFRAVVENSRDGLLFCNEKGEITYRSPSNKNINGYDNDEREGNSIFDTIHPDDLGPVKEFFHEVMNKPQADLSIKHRIQHKEGHWLSVETFGRNFLHIPELEFIAFITKDRTEIAELKSEIERFKK